MQKVTLDLDNQIDSIKESRANIGDGNAIKVKHVVIPSMNDGKSLNAISTRKIRETKPKAAAVATIVCSVCLKSMKHFTKSFYHRPVVKEVLKYGCAPLHTRMNCFQNLFKAGCSKKATEQGCSYKEMETILKTKFREELGIRVFEPEVGGGNSNTGNVGRRFFSNAKKSAEILDIDVEIIEKVKELLDIISSATKFHDPDQFQLKAVKVWKMYCTNLAEYRGICPTFHRLLAHGDLYLQFAKDIGVPLGKLSESAIEARNIDNKTVRRYHSRTCGFVEQNTDSFHWLSWTSDPVVCSLRRKPKRGVRY